MEEFMDKVYKYVCENGNNVNLRQIGDKPGLPRRGPEGQVSAVAQKGK
jgi:hypothetical protein